MLKEESEIRLLCRCRSTYVELVKEGTSFDSERHKLID